HQGMAVGRRYCLCRTLASVMNLFRRISLSLSHVHQRPRRLPPSCLALTQLTLEHRLSPSEHTTLIFTWTDRVSIETMRCSLCCPERAIETSARVRQFRFHLADMLTR